MTFTSRSDTLGHAAPIKPDVGVNEAALSPVFLQPLSCYARHLRLKYRPVCVPRCPAKHLHRCISYFARTRWQGDSLVAERVFHPNRTRFSTSQLQRFSVATVARTLNVNDCPKAADGFQITTPRRVLPVFTSDRSLQQKRGFYGDSSQHSGCSSYSSQVAGLSFPDSS